MTNIQQLKQELLQPSEALISDLAKLDGDILILGVGGKMGPALAKLARQAIAKAGVNKKVIGVSRFSEAGLQEELNDSGIETYAADLLEDEQLQLLPDVKNVLYLAGTKFGTTGKESFTWAMNTYLPGRVAQKYKNSRIVVFSTGNVYPLSPVSWGGVAEDRLPEPVGEYAQSCLGRERLFQYYSVKYNIPTLIFRLNYANDTGYGVLLEIAKSVKEERAIDLSMGHVNVIWQGDANEMAIRSLHHCETPTKILNITGPETISVRWLAGEFGKIFGKTPLFMNEEQSTALLNNAAESFRIFGYPRVPLKRMIELLAAWVQEGGQTLNKPTHFQERKGQF
ncbi:MAG: NAD-dependent epimerase/dehydratase [Chitinophagaceae bacterium]|nr:NAD-dependent epimerase/dehydratase [Chitinophagaceae bacterium]